MWPWSLQDVKQELPESLQDFYSQADALHQKRLVDTQRNVQVQKVLAKRAAPYDHQLEKYKRQHKVETVATINCAELQNAVVECYRGWTFLRGTECSAEIGRTSQCIDLQQRALKSLRYGSCYSETQCRQIKAAVDVLFTENFGRLGDTLGDAESHARFDADLDRLFPLVWGEK